MTRMQAYEFLCNVSEEVGFLANVILTQHKNPAGKLKKLARMILDGSNISLIEFSIDSLLVNGTSCKIEEVL